MVPKWCPNAMCALEMDSFLGLRKPGNWPFGDDPISRTQKDYCKTVKDVQETEVQFSSV